MSDSLKKIQLIAKIGKIISKVMFILMCVVFSMVCITTIVSATFGIDRTVKLGEIEIKGLIDNISDMSTVGIYVYLASALIMSAAYAVLAKFSEKYFDNELAAGNPFTAGGAKEIFRLGVLSISLPLGSFIITDAVTSALSHFFDGIKNVEFNNGGIITVGIMFIVLSFVFRYGAELKQKNHSEE